MKRFPSSEGRNRNLHTFCGNPLHSRLKQAKIAALNGESFDGNKRFALLRAVMKGHSLQHATGIWKNCLMKSARLDLTAADFAQILQDCRLRKPLSQKG